MWTWKSDGHSCSTLLKIQSNFCDTAFICSLLVSTLLVMEKNYQINVYSICGDTFHTGDNCVVFTLKTVSKILLPENIEKFL